MARCLRHLRRYRLARREPADFDAFWAETLRESDALAGEVTWEPVDNGLRLVTTFDVTFPGWLGQPVKAWLHLPAEARQPVAAVVELSGFGQGRGLPHERVLNALAGHAYLIVDARGQSGGDRSNDTPDITTEPLDTSDLITRGVRDPRTSYLRRLITDSVRAVEAVRALPGVDPTRVAVAGTSQGGGLALAAAALGTDVTGLVADVPFLTGWWRGVALASAGPYTEVRQYRARNREAAAQVWCTLGYTDGMNFAARCAMPGRFSVGLADLVCPPSAVFAAYNHYRGPKDIDVWPYNGHEGGQAEQERRNLQYLDCMLSAETRYRGSACREGELADPAVEGVRAGNC